MNSQSTAVNDLSTHVINCIGQYVIVRGYASGVHFGVLKDYCPITRHAVVSDHRIIHYWKGAFTLNAVVTNGIKDGRVSMAIPEKIVTDVLEIMKCAEEARNNLRDFPTYMPPEVTELVKCAEEDGDN